MAAHRGKPSFPTNGEPSCNPAFVVTRSARPVSTWLARVCACVAVLGVLVSWCVPAEIDGTFPVPQLAAAGPWYTVPALAAMLLGLRSHRRVTAAIGAACVAVQIAVLAAFGMSVAVQGLSSAGGDTASASAGGVRVMTLNAYHGLADAQEIVATVRDEGVSVLCIQEATASFTGELEAAGLAAYLPNRAGGAVGNQIWSSLPLEDAVTDAVGYSGSVMPAATAVLPDGSRIRFVSVHTCSPTFGYEGLWHLSLALLSEVGTRDDGWDGAVPYVLMGDFNASLYHASFRAVLDAGFTDGALQAGEGLAFTWPAGVAVPAFVTLDHILLADGLVASSFVYVDVSGSDHRAVVATVTAG